MHALLAFNWIVCKVDMKSKNERCDCRDKGKQLTEEESNAQEDDRKERFENALIMRVSTG